MSVDVSPDGKTLVFDLLGDVYTLPIEGTGNLSAGIAALGQLLREYPECDAIYFGSDLLAVGAQIAARETGIAIPQRLAMGGYGDLEFAKHLTTRQPFRGPCCLITFDDGWVDNFENALPVLRAHRLPAVMFLPVNFIGRRRLFTREALTHLLVRAIDVGRREPARREALRAHLSPTGLASVLDTTDRDSLPAVLKVMSGYRYANAPALETLTQPAALFREFREPAARCRFSDCRHLREPDCGVQAALAAGVISARRYESYRRLARLQARFAEPGARRR